MPESFFEENMHIAEQEWNKFISLIKEDLKALEAESRKLTSEIKNAERITRVSSHSHEDIDFLIAHKESYIRIDSSLSQKFATLEKVLKEIQNNENIKKAVSELEYSRERKATIDEEIDRLYDLVNDNVINIDKDIIARYSKKHGLNAEQEWILTCYPVFKLHQKMMHRIPKKSSPIVEEILEIDNELLKGTRNHKDYFDSLKNRYEEIKNASSALLNKYYDILQKMSQTESKYYKIYCSMTEDELKHQPFDEGYDEVIAKIAALKIFDAKTEIEILFQTIANENYENKYDIDFLAEYINEYELLLEKLKETDKKIVDSEEEEELQNSEDLRAFFSTDENMKALVPDFVKEDSHIGSLINIIDKAQGGHIQSKKGNIKELKADLDLKDLLGKTVFITINSKIIVSYVKVNSGTGINDGGILILTVSPLKPNTIKEETEKVVREHRDQILKQIAALEKGDLQEIENQRMIVDEFKRVHEESELNGRKPR